MHVFTLFGVGTSVVEGILDFSYKAQQVKTVKIILNLIPEIGYYCV